MQIEIKGLDKLQNKLQEVQDKIQNTQPLMAELAKLSRNRTKCSYKMRPLKIHF